ncbi:MAG: hypothetical protein ACRC5A_01245 [Enterobacteriaceae bacterium]
MSPKCVSHNRIDFNRITSCFNKVTCCLLAALSAPMSSYAQEWFYPGWEESASNRRQAELILNEFNQQLLTRPSATVTLTQWCSDHHLAQEAKIVAIRDRDTIKEADRSVLNALQVPDATDIGYRRVKLICGDYVLSEADNWYLKSRLTDKMNQELDNSDTPFGTVVRDLHFTRQTIAVQILWHPMQEQGKDKQIAIPDYVLQHQAILYDAEKHPFSTVIESYRNNLFRFPLK